MLGLAKWVRFGLSRHSVGIIHFSDEIRQTHVFLTQISCLWLLAQRVFTEALLSGHFVQIYVQILENLIFSVQDLWGASSLIFRLTFLCRLCIFITESGVKIP